MSTLKQQEKFIKDNAFNKYHFHTAEESEMFLDVLHSLIKLERIAKGLSDITMYCRHDYDTVCELADEIVKENDL